MALGLGDASLMEGGLCIWALSITRKLLGRNSNTDNKDE